MDLRHVWNRCNIHLPLKDHYSVTKKLQRFLEDVNLLNHNKKKSKKFLAEMEVKKNKLFDISACGCNLPIVHCGSEDLVDCPAKGTGDTCGGQHILCHCEDTKKVPPLERAYLRDQRLKTGTHGGQFQMGLPDARYTKRVQRVKDQVQRFKDQHKKEAAVQRRRRRTQFHEQEVVDISFSEASSDGSTFSTDNNLQEPAKVKKYNTTQLATFITQCIR